MGIEKEYKKVFDEAMSELDCMKAETKDIESQLADMRKRAKEIADSAEATIQRSRRLFPG